MAGNSVFGFSVKIENYAEILSKINFNMKIERDDNLIQTNNLGLHLWGLLVVCPEGSDLSATSVFGNFPKCSHPMALNLNVMTPLNCE